MSSDPRGDVGHDVQAIQRIDAVTSILEIVCRTTGMGFAAVARVTEERWIACAVKDDIQFTPLNSMPLTGWQPARPVSSA